MKKISILLLSLCLATIMGACSNDDVNAAEIDNRLTGNTRTLVAYFSATGNTQAVAERIAQLTGADIFRIEAAEPYAANPYNDSDRIQREAYNDLRPAVAELLSAEQIAKYDTIYVGTPTWWHQPAMVVCTFLESYDLSGKVVVPFATYGATTYLNETLQKLYKCTPNSTHIPATLPEDVDPDDIQHPQNDDSGIDQPGNANGVEAWMRRMGLLGNGQGSIATIATDIPTIGHIYSLNGMRLTEPPTSGVYITDNKIYIAK